MKHTLTINGREAELDISVMDRGDRVAVFATVGFVRYSSSGYKSVRHAVYEDFAEYYNATARPKRLTQAFKNKMISGVDIDTVKRHVEAHYSAAE